VIRRFDPAIRELLSRPSVQAAEVPSRAEPLGRVPSRRTRRSARRGYGRRPGRADHRRHHGTLRTPGDPLRLALALAEEPPGAAIRALAFADCASTIRPTFSSSPTGSHPGGSYPAAPST
jgi:hypothetical protein